MRLSALAHHLGENRKFGLGQFSPDSVNSTRDEEKPVRQNHPPQARHAAVIIPCHTPNTSTAEFHKPKL